MGWEYEITQAYLQKLADQILPGTVVRSLDLVEKAYKALKPPEPAIATTYSASGWWSPNLDDYTYEAPKQEKVTKWSLTHKDIRETINIPENANKKEVKELVTATLTDMRLTISKYNN